ncbi:hypothetical protein AKJ50_00780 [candidate division MSBL1 archaeon SCGC-AAA382A13]|uniref:type I site-specific deoxyribonuclease n=1 Tax=candidate division MSBL1 archaeon SCGC-AAA382A13 TaxID=1698279 RepID=A0A133VGD8_9EURY|nr:hypothetical protein AKJ50_00780 [candidate division MSBL1 archaeon SCGC-AAA382A13]
MKKFGEYGVHASVLDWLESNGWNTWGDPERNLWGSEVLDKKVGRETDQVVYWNILKKKIVELNDKINEQDAGEVIEMLKRDLTVENLVEGNKKFYKVLSNGKKYTLGPEHDNETIRVRLIAHPDDPDYDFSINENRFDAVTEFKVERKKGIRPDIVLFVNGIPLVTIELKSTAQDATVDQAISDMRDYEEVEPRLFVPGLLNGVCDGKEFRYAAVGSPEEFYFPWRSDEFEEGDYQPRDAVKSLFEPETLIDIFRYFVFYEENQTKVVPRYMQYYASEKILGRIKEGEPKKGLIWHTQGSGKSYTMLFAAYKAKKSPEIEDSQYLLIVDRKKLDDQMADTLAAIDFPSYSVAKNIDHLGKLLGENKAQLILTTIHKFGGVDDEVKGDVDLDTVVMVDEAHRYMERKLGNKLKAAVPDASYFGFTGTPVMEGEDLEDRNTFREFSPPEDEGYLHRYSLNDGIRDEVITRVTFTLKNIPWEIPDEKRMDMEFEEMVQNLGPEEKRKMLREYVNQTELTELRDRMEKVTEDIVDHYDRHLRPLGFKGMVVTPSRRAAALYGDELEKYMDPDEVKVVITTSGEDPEVIKRRYMTDEDERNVIKEFKEEDDPKLLVVCDKLLTGFDAPILKSMYLDKSMKNHRLLQAIARTNRPMEGKANGEIVDYAGVFADPEKVLQYEDVEFVAQAARDTEELVDEFLEKLEELISFFEDIEFDGSPESFQKCIVRLEKNPEVGNKFEDLYKEAENLYESVSPHERLGREDVEQNWAIISQIYEEFKREEDRVSLSGEIRAKTRDVLERHIAFGKIGPGKGVEYELPDREVKVVEGDIDPDYAVVDEGGRMRHTYENKGDKNIVYSSLSERVKKIMERWRRDEISASEAMEKLEEIKEQEDEIQSEQDERKLSGVEFSLFQLLTMEYNDFISGKGEAEDLAMAIGESVSDLSLEGNLSQIKQDLRSEVIQTLVDHGKTSLAKHDDKVFLDDSIQYIVKNVED